MSGYEPPDDMEPEIDSTPDEQTAEEPDPEEVPATGESASEADKEAPPPEPALPVTGQERIVSLDVVRGFALLGILGINVWAYGLPFPAAMDPHLLGFDTLIDHVVYVLVSMTVFSKTMPIFSMLFGAGIVLFATRTEARGHKPAGLFARRQFWLWIFGLVHAYLLWNGDILVPYAVTGLIMYLFRKKRPRTLLVLALSAMVVQMTAYQGIGALMGFVEGQAQEAAVAEAAGEPLTEWQERSQEIWEGTGPTWSPDAGDLAKLNETMRGGYTGILANRAGETVMMHLFMYPLTAGWGIAGYMLLGMALFKYGVFSGERSAGFYRKLVAAGYGLGVPLAAVAVLFHFTHYTSMGWMLQRTLPFQDVGGTLVALGHISVLVLAVKEGRLAGLGPRLAAVGRMAFTNYITHTIICTTIFYGYGLGQFAAWNRLSLLGLALAIWALQLWWSPWWLSRFRFGPLEWVWRSLTYRGRQPFRRAIVEPGP